MEKETVVDMGDPVFTTEPRRTRRKHKENQTISPLRSLWSSPCFLRALRGSVVNALPPASTALAVLALLLSGCLKVPPYKTPTTAVPEAFKEAPPEGWKEAQPNDGALRGKWWEIFGDPALNQLEEQVAISNQNILQAEANFREAKALVRIQRSALFPLVTGTPSVAGEQGSTRLASPSNGKPFALLELPVNASYTVDLWGAIHRTIAAAANTAQATAAERTDRGYNSNRRPLGAECLRHFPAAGPLDNSRARGPRVSTPAMGSRALPGGVCSRRHVCGDVSRRLVGDLRSWALR